MIEGDTSGIPVPPFDYRILKRFFGGVIIANNGFDKAQASKALAEGRADPPSVSLSSQIQTW